MRDALLDLWLLGRTDALVVTSGSTFGYVAHARTSKVPRLVMLEKKRGKGSWETLAWEPPRCEHSETFEPCFHVWPMMLALSCFKGDVHAARRLFGQQNCRPWDMEMFKTD
eukprot:CAMPEP_0180275668 /NCGR_PEP_ID=MMETSP0988-20121125/5961_1 /TAXON_ID=697907 /ORGANISM="non described non described, Strain CCMP2293" /LENGTH=110 /DNA_ID=CAMNT_0022246941 /DNA_START=1273 /DNA_END=1605 /DNA_ORIENTATION=-